MLLSNLPAITFTCAFSLRRQRRLGRPHIYPRSCRQGKKIMCSLNSTVTVYRRPAVIRLCPLPARTRTIRRMTLDTAHNGSSVPYMYICIYIYIYMLLKLRRILHQRGSFRAWGSFGILLPYQCWRHLERKIGLQEDYPGIMLRIQRRRSDSAWTSWVGLHRLPKVRSNGVNLTSLHSTETDPIKPRLVCFQVLLPRTLLIHRTVQEIPSTAHQARLQKVAALSEWSGVTNHEPRWVAIVSIAELDC
ncbi:hypothetical protein F5B21DRAFT_20899 [Xylaria acuta]|nr:hypothetical protein F5B21DRAFT_20899 [Xylaria acuta]